MELTPKNTIVLPRKLTYPRGCWDERNYWFDKFPNSSDLTFDFIKRNKFDSNCVTALLAKGIEQNEAPTIAYWVSFTLAGAFIAAKTRKYIVPPEQEPYDWEHHLEMFVWEVLFRTIQWKRHPLDSNFVTAMLREFAPRYNMGGPYDHAFHRSSFAGVWPYLDQPTFMRSVHPLMSQTLQRGNNAFDTLSKEVQDSILKVAEHVPTMLEIAIARIRNTYSW